MGLGSAPRFGKLRKRSRVVTRFRQVNALPGRLHGLEPGLENRRFFRHRGTRHQRQAGRQAERAGQDQHRRFSGRACLAWQRQGLRAHANRRARVRHDVRGSPSSDPKPSLDGAPDRLVEEDVAKAGSARALLVPACGHAWRSHGWSTLAHGVRAKAETRPDRQSGHGSGEMSGHAGRLCSGS